MAYLPLIAQASTIAASVAHFGYNFVRKRRIAGAIAPALICDLNIVLLALDGVKYHALQIERHGVTPHEEIERVLRSVARIHLSAFDRFNDMLPYLGKNSAHIVIECYTTIARTVTLIREDLETNPATPELEKALIAMATGADQLSKKVNDAQEHLRKHAS
jgi:hypothetical protein